MLWSEWHYAYTVGVQGFCCALCIRASIVEGAERAVSLRGGRERSMEAFRYAPTAASGETLAPLPLAQILGPATIMRCLPAGGGVVISHALSRLELATGFSSMFSMLCFKLSIMLPGITRFYLLLYIITNVSCIVTYWYTMYLSDRLESSASWALKSWCKRFSKRSRSACMFQ